MDPLLVSVRQTDVDNLKRFLNALKPSDSKDPLTKVYNRLVIILDEIVRSAGVSSGNPVALPLYELWITAYLGSAILDPESDEKKLASTLVSKYIGPAREKFLEWIQVYIDRKTE